MVKEPDLSIQEKKEIIYQIIEEEKRKYGITFETTPIIIGKIFSSTAYKKNLKLSNPDSQIRYITPWWSGVYKDKEKTLFIVIENVCKLIPMHYLADLIMFCYHEVKHVYQDNIAIKEPTYHSFLMQIETEIIKTKFGRKNYAKYHDNYLFEIDANIYMIERTMEYLKKSSYYSERDKKYLENLQKKYEKGNNMYDVSEKIGMIDRVVKMKPAETLEKISMLNFFYKQDGSFKPISEIMVNIDKIDSEIIEAMLSSDVFLKQLPSDKLNEEEREFMIDILKKVYEKELKKHQSENVSVNDLKEYLHYSKSIIEKINNINKFLTKLITKSMSYEKDTRFNRVANNYLELLEKSTEKNGKKH